MALRVLLIGGGGVFGSRIARALAHDPRFALTLAGRHPASLQRLRERLGGPSIGVASLDVATPDLAAAMAPWQPQLVIHAAGPFQQQDYRVAEACLAPFVFASHGYESFHLLMPLYLCRRWQGQVERREHAALKWVRPAQMGELPMPPADIPLVAYLRDFI